MGKFGTNITTFQVCKEKGLVLEQQQNEKLGLLVRQAWNQITDTIPHKVKCKAGYKVNSYPADFKPVIINCIDIVIKQGGTTENLIPA